MTEVNTLKPRARLLSVRGSTPIQSASPLCFEHGYYYCGTINIIFCIGKAAQVLWGDTASI